MKKSALLLFLLATLFACDSPNSYKITGAIDDSSWNGKQVTLFAYSQDNDLIPLDSALIKDQAFVLKGKVDTAGWYVLLLQKENGQPIVKDFYVEGSLDFSLKNGKTRMTGGSVNDSYQAFGDEYDKLTEKLLRLNEALKENPSDKILEKSFNEEYARFESVFRKLALKSILDNIDNPLGLHLFQTSLSSLENQDLEAVLANASPEFLADPTVKMVSLQLEKSKKVQIGSRFSDLTMSGPDGGSISLSQYVGKGKYVMIDFWASWCGPCIQEMPNVLACYRKYRSKGFEIVGVSLDEDPKAWKAAIENQSLPWPQMSDLAGWKSQAVSVYSFSGIPHTVLIDPQGVIIAKDLRGQALEAKLSELLGK